MEIDQAFEQFKKGEIPLFALMLIEPGGDSYVFESDTSQKELSRKMLMRKVDDKTIALVAWRAKEDAENGTTKLKLSLGKYLVYEFNEPEFAEFYKREQQQGYKLLIEIA
jgi:hypothetical protein